MDTTKMDASKTPPRTEMATLKNMLAQCLSPHDGDSVEDTLKRQLITLNWLFEHTLDDFAQSPTSLTSDKQMMRLSLLMRLQQNCTATARTISAIEYMAALAPAAKEGAPLPENRKRTKDGA